MTRQVAPNASHHYWGFGIKNSTMADNKYAACKVLIRGTGFESGNEIESETDEGHTGVSNLNMGSYRSTASSSPAWEDKWRYTEGLEDMFYMLLGTVGDGTGVAPTQIVAPGTGENPTPGVYKYKFTFPVGTPENPPKELPFCTIYNGFAKTVGDGRVFNNAVMSEFEATFSNEEAPTLKTTFLSDYNNMNMANPLRNFSSVTTFVKPKQVKVYYGNVGDNAQTMLTKELGCFLESSFSVNNNFESQPCQEDEFGKNSKFMGAREPEGSIKLPWTTATKTLEPEYEALTTSGHLVSEDTLYKQVWYKITGSLIIESQSTSYYYETLIKFPKVEITKVESPLSGDEAKDLTIEYKPIEDPSYADGFMTAEVQTSLASLHIDNTTGLDIGAIQYPAAQNSGSGGSQ